MGNSEQLEAVDLSVFGKGDDRLREGFLPRWTNYHFERTDYYNGIFAVLAMVAIGLLYGVFAVVADGRLRMPVTLAGIFLLAAVFIIAALVEKRQKKAGTMLLEDRTVSRDLFGRASSVTYAEWSTAVSEGGFRITEEGYLIRRGKDRLLFGYEAGDSKMQGHVLDLYAKFREKVPGLPEMTAEGIGSLDRRFTYEKNSWGGVVGAAVCSLFSLAGKLFGYPQNIFVYAVCAAVQLHALYRMFANAVMMEKVTEKVNGELKLEGERSLSGRSGYIRFYAASAVILVLNLLIIVLSF